MIKISPSVNLVKNGNLKDYVLLMQESGADYLHCDVMDGEFVPTKCLTLEDVSKLSYETLLPLDVHLMVSNPINVLKKYSKLRVFCLTTHFEAYSDDFDVLRAVEIVHKKGILFGLSIKPGTRIERVFRFLPYIDMLLIMSVEPGKSGQSFQTKSLKRIEKTRAYLNRNKISCKIEVDGGVNENNIQSIVNSGADIVAMASSIYKQKNKKSFISKLKKIKVQTKRT